MAITINGAPRALWHFSFISSAIFINPCTRPPTPTVAARASRLMSLPPRKTSTMPGTTRLWWCLRSSLERTTPKPLPGNSKRCIHLPASLFRGNPMNQNKSVGVAPIGEDRCLSRARDSGVAVQSTFLRFWHKLTRGDESGLHGARGASCREPTREGRISAGGAAQSDLALSMRRVHCELLLRPQAT